MKALLLSREFAIQQVPFLARVTELVGHDQFTTTYIPSVAKDSKSARKYYQMFLESSGLSEEKVQYASLDASEGELRGSLKLISQAEVIFLSGGPTYYFLKVLRSSGALELLREKAAHDGIFIGASAGAMILTPSIVSAELSFVGDTKGEPNEDDTALGILPFLIAPHLDPMKARHLDELRRFTKHQGMTLFALSDASCLTVIDDLIVSDGTIVQVSPINTPNSQRKNL